MKKTKLKEYARLIAVKGANVQKDQEVWITASLDQPEFVEMLVKECYSLGAKEVAVDWQHAPLSVLDSNIKPISSLSGSIWILTIPTRLSLPDRIR